MDPSEQSTFYRGPADEEPSVFDGSDPFSPSYRGPADEEPSVFDGSDPFSPSYRGPADANLAASGPGRPQLALHDEGLTDVGPDRVAHLLSAKERGIRPHVVLDLLSAPLTAAEADSIHDRVVQAIRLDVMTRYANTCHNLVGDEEIGFASLAAEALIDCKTIEKFTGILEPTVSILEYVTKALRLENSGAELAKKIIDKAVGGIVPGVEPLKWTATVIRGVHLIVCPDPLRCPNLNALTRELVDIVEVVAHCIN